MPDLIQKEIENKEYLNIFNKIMNYFNSSNINNTIQKIESAFKNITNKTEITNIESKIKQLFNKTTSQIKSVTKLLNITILSDIFQNLENLNDQFKKEGFIKRQNISEILENIFNRGPNLTSLINEHRNGLKEIFESTKEKLDNLLGRNKANNNIELDNILEDQIEQGFKFIVSLFNGTLSWFNNIINIKPRKLEDNNNDNILLQLIEKLKEKNKEILTALSTKEISKTFENLKNNEEISKTLIEIKNIFNGSLNYFADKIVKIEYTSIKEQISNILKIFTKAFDELKQSDFNLDTIIQKLSGTFENNLNLFDANEFTKIFDGFLSKIDEAKENLITSIKGKRDFYLSNLREEINGLTEKIKGRLEGYDLISTLKNNANAIIEFIKDKIGIFNKEEILNKNGIAGSQENIINKLSQIPIINSISKLNSSLTNIKNDIIDKIKNTEENMNKLRQHISSLFTKSFNISSLRKK